MAYLSQLFENQCSFLLSLLSLLFFLFLFFQFIFKIRKLRSNSFNHNLPPSPWKLPVIGNLHQLAIASPLPHHALHSFAQKHGPLMLLHLGQVPTLVVSSASVAREILKTHDRAFSGRPHSRIANKLLYGKDVIFSPYGTYWRQVRKICILHLLSVKRVQSFRLVREEEVARMVDRIERMVSSTSTSPGFPNLVNLSEILYMLTHNIACRAALGMKVNSGKDKEGAKELKRMVKEFGYLLGVFDIGNVIPSLTWLNNVNGLKKRVEKNFKELDKFLDGVLEEHIRKRKRKKEMVSEDVDAFSRENDEDLVDSLLKIQEDNSSHVQLQNDNIKALIMNMFTGATETTYTTLEWAMAELIKHPEEMKEVQEEVRCISKGKSIVTEDDINKLHYLKAVIKETLRMHPPLPLLAPHESIENVKIRGYNIQAKTTVLLNAWAIGRDPSMWEEPERFRPKRFMKNGNEVDIDFKGQDFQFIPFGAGRRGCPGNIFAMATVELGLANLLKRFEWKMPMGNDEKKVLNMAESAGIPVHLKDNLVLVPLPYC